MRGFVIYTLFIPLLKFLSIMADTETKGKGPKKPKAGDAAAKENQAQNTPGADTLATNTPGPDSNQGNNPPPAQEEPPVTAPPVMPSENNGPGLKSMEDLANIPVPSGEEAERTAQQLADSPEWLAAFVGVVTRANEIIADRNKPAPPTPDELSAMAHERLVKQYGKDFVRAENSTGNKTIFSRKSWNQMPKHKNGWREIIKTMPEVE